MGLRCTGHCVEAGARMTQPLHLPLSFQLKVTAVPGLLLSLSLGSFSKEYPAGPSPRPMAKPGALSTGEGGPSPGTRPTTWEDSKPGFLPWGIRIRKPVFPFFSSFPSRTHDFRDGSHRLTWWGHRDGRVMRVGGH